jgi:lysophospholipase L1-like esterase
VTVTPARWPARRAWLVLAAALALGALAALWLAQSADTSGPARPTAGDQIIAFGDSLVVGVGASPGRDLVSQLSGRLGVPIVNAGRNGDTTVSALARLDQAVLGRRPRVVLVLLGGNDLIRRVPPDETIDNLGAIVRRIRDRGAAVVLATVEIAFFTRSRDDEYETLAARTGAALVPGILDGILGRRDLMADAIHPNDRGYALIADRLEPVLRDLLH